MAENNIVYTPIQGTNKEKLFNHVIFKGEVQTLAGNNHSTSSFKDSVFSTFWRIMYGSKPSEMDIRWLFPRRHIKLEHKQNIENVFHDRKVPKMHQIWTKYIKKSNSDE